MPPRPGRGRGLRRHRGGGGGGDLRPGGLAHPMRLDLPEPVAQAERDAGRNADELRIALPADLTLEGVFGTRWFLVDDAGARVYGLDEDDATLLRDVPLEEIASPHAEALVGGGALQVRRGDEVVDLVRYSNAHERAFGQAASFFGKILEYRRKRAAGEDAEPPEEKTSDAPPKRCPTCGLLLPEGSQSCPACLKKHRVIMRIVDYLRPYWKQTGGVIALLLLARFSQLVPPYLNRPLVDDVLRGTSAPAAERLSELGYLVLILFGSMLISQGIGILQGRRFAWLGTRVGHDLRTEVYRHLHRQSMRFFDRHQTGALMARVDQDTRQLEGALIDGVPHFVGNIVMLLGIGGVLFALNWKLTLLILIPGPLVLIISRLIWKRLFVILHRWWHTRARLSAALNDSLSGMRVIKAFARERQETGRFEDYSGRFAEAMLAVERYWSTFFPLMSLLTMLGSLIVWYVGGASIIRGNGMTLGTLLVFIGYLHMLYGPLQFMSRISDWLARALASAERIFEILDTAPDVPECEEPVPMPRITGRVEFRDIVFGYDPHKPVLKEVNLEVEPGEMIGLVGHSGAGKSTTINLLCRFYDVDEGAIVIDGVDIRNIAQEDLRRQIGVVLQDTFLFNDTILENIRYARPDADPEAVMAAAKAANAHDFIVRKPDGYDTLVGERGITLSGGERQRISIARAILHNPRILILDEATSSVDTDTEQEIQEAIARLVKGRTTFAIAHRLSTLRNADRLVVLKDGKIEESGTHEELMRKQGEFFRLVQKQRAMSRITAVQG